MDTKLIVIFILSGALGAIIVITGCIKVLSKTGSLDVKSAGFILAGFLFVALPVLGTVSIEWGEFKMAVNTTNEKALELQSALDSLKIANQKLQEELEDLRNKVTDYGQLMSNPHITFQQKALATQNMNISFERVSAKIGSVNTSIDSARIKNTRVLNEIEKFEDRRWYNHPGNINSK